MFYLVGISSSGGYALHVLPALPLLGFGFGLIFAPAINTATAGVAPHDAGVASAMVNTMQQVGGSVGTALLSTLAASATAAYARSHAGPGVAADAAVHGYSIAFLVSGAIFIAGAFVAFFLIRHHHQAAAETGSAPSADEGAADADDTIPRPARHSG
nr:hypothetical protein [Micromonospora sp. DSM 115978]